MNTVNPYLKKYQQNEVETASPEKLLILLYDAAILFLNKAKNGILINDTEKKHKNLVACQKIILEFMDTLDMEAGGELAQNLYRLYEYLYEALVTANVESDSKRVDEVSRHLKNMRETWQKAINISNAKKKQSLQEEESNDDKDSYEDEDEYESEYQEELV